MPYNFAADPQTLTVSDPYHGENFSQTGRVFVYDWVGNNLNFAQEIIPPGGLAGNDQWGRKIAVRGDLLAIASSGSNVFEDELHIYRKVSGTWVLEQNPTPPGAYYIFFNLGISNGKILATRYNPTFQLVVFEKIGSSWVETPISPNPSVIPSS